jgi:phosphatidylinositol-3-phosphatase
MRLRLLGVALAVAVAVAAAVGFYATRLRPSVTGPVTASHLDRVIILVLESYRSDEVDPVAITSNPFLTKLVAENRIELNYYGVWKPSLPNYLAMIGGDVFGIHNNRGSCFNPTPPTRCNSVDAPNLVDQFEAANIAWEGLFEAMPSAGFLGETSPDKNALYAQKHNPFVYFKSVALNPARLVKVKPFVPDELRAELADPVLASKFIYIVPNLCDDEHGAADCRNDAATLAAGDAFLAKTVPAILSSPAFSDRSVLFITWDNSTGNGACCGDWIGGGRLPLIAVTKHAKRVRGTTPTNHYSLLATVEEGFGLPRLANAKGAATLFDLLPDFAEKHDAHVSAADGSRASSH